MNEHEAEERLRRLQAEQRASGDPRLQWCGLLPSGAPGIAAIERTLKLILHVRIYAPEHFDALVTAVRQLAERNRELANDTDIPEREQADADSERARWEDLLFVLDDYGASEDDAAA